MSGSDTDSIALRDGSYPCRSFDCHVHTVPESLFRSPRPKAACASYEKCLEILS